MGNSWERASAFKDWPRGVEFLAMSDIPEELLSSARGVMGAYVKRFIKQHQLPESMTEPLLGLADFFYQEGWIDRDDYEELVQ